MATTANLRTTVGTLFGTVNTGAATIADTLSTVTDAVGMANNFVATMAAKQKARNKLELGKFEEKLLEEASMEEAIRRKEINKFCQDDELKRLYLEAHAKFAKLLED